jgi:hypothetical protein
LTSLIESLFSKEGLGAHGKESPFEKGETGGFEFDFSRRHRLNFFNELHKHHTSLSFQWPRLVAMLYRLR